MPLAVLQDKLETIDESYYDLVNDFLDFIKFKQSEEQTGIDAAIEELKNGEVEHYNTFEDFKAAMT